jgi:hypothetical protein
LVTRIHANSHYKGRSSPGDRCGRRRAFRVRRPGKSSGRAGDPEGGAVANGPNPLAQKTIAITVYDHFKHPSRIELPIIPLKPTVFEGAAKIHTHEGKYDGSVELYAFRDDVYLHYENQWIKWEVVKNWQTGSLEHYKGEGELGKSSVLIQSNHKASFGALATGRGIHFKGNAKQ